MKRVFGCVVICMVFMVFGVVAAFAEDKVYERPQVKIIIDGEVGTYEDVPVIVNDRTLLPLRAILVNLGVKNDDEHIQWNNVQKSVTIIKDKIKVYLKINSSTVYVNDQSLKLDVEPIIYKNRTYIPARFVSQTLGKKVFWDGETKSVFIRDESDFLQVKEIMEKTNTAMRGVERVKSEVSLVSEVSDNHQNIKSKSSISSELDVKNKVSHMLVGIQLNGKDAEIGIECYYDKDMSYFKIPGMEQWSRVPIPEQEVEANYTVALDPEEFVYAGLLAHEEENGDTVLLKGNVYLKEVFQESTGMLDDFTIDSAYAEIVIDKETGFIDTLHIKVDGNIHQGGSDFKFSQLIDVAYSDYNGEFQVKVPQKVKESAVDTVG